ncbi:Mu transposase domain-containing protein [Nonomuraea sp. NPDC003201]
MVRSSACERCVITWPCGRCRPPRVVAQRHLRYVGKDCLVAFEANLYSVPAHRVRPRQLVEVRATKAQIMLHATTPDHTGQTLLAAHRRAVGRGCRVVDERHRDGLPTGAGRRVTTGRDLSVPQGQGKHHNADPPAGSSLGLLNRTAAAHVEVGRRPLSGQGTRWTSSEASRSKPPAVQACEAAGGRDVAIASGGATVNQPRRGLIDEPRLHLAAST